MITRMDRTVGRLLALLEELGLDEDTLVMFTSDNGATFNGGTDRPFFHSNGDLRGGKCEVYEGGIRVPLVARWPGRIAPGTTSDHVSAFWDMLPTFAEAAGAVTPANTDGISLLPTLTGQGLQSEHEYLYWEYFGTPSRPCAWARGRACGAMTRRRVGRTIWNSITWSATRPRP